MVIDGDVSIKNREKRIKEFQEGKYQVGFIHPQSAGHGLTLTKARSTIWCSPTYNAEHHKQLNKRIYRATQTRKTETIMICGNDTWEEQVYERLGGKLEKMDDLLDSLQQNYEANA
jgi:SNF2 family DNA or RNA helicase